MTKTNFKRVRTHYGFGWIRKDEKYFLEKENGKYYIFRMFGPAKYFEDGTFCYDNVEGGSSCEIPRFARITEVDEFLADEAKVAEFFRKIDASMAR